MARNKAFFVDRICEMNGLDPGDPGAREPFMAMNTQELVAYLGNLEENEETPISFSEFLGCSRMHHDN
jgi:hypothetical protein